MPSPVSSSPSPVFRPRSDAQRPHQISRQEISHPYQTRGCQQIQQIMLLGEQGREQHQDGYTDPKRFEFGQPLGPEDGDDQGRIGVSAGQGVVDLIASIDP